MSTLDFLISLRERGVVVRLAPDGATLTVNAPKGALDESRRSELAARKDDILRFLAHAAAEAEPAVAPLGRRDDGAPLRLSAAQERVWNLHRLSRGDAGLNVPVAWTISGAVDITRLQSCLAVVVRRHETLRSRFVEGRDGPVVSIVEDVPAIELIEISAAREPLDAVTAFCERPFDLGSEVMRVGFAALGGDQYLFAAAFHQIVFDWGAANPFVSELSTLYQAEGDPADVVLDELEIGYLDFAAWQHDWLDGDAAGAQETYWSDQLDRPYAALAIPRGETASPGDAQVHRHTFSIDRASTDDLRKVAQGSGASMFMTLLAMWQSVLAAHSGADEALTFTMMGLHRPELKRLVGLFANPLPLRVDLSGDPTPVELGRRVSEVAVGAFRHQDLPLDRVIDRAAAVAPAGQSGLFQSLFIFQHEPTAPLELGSAATELVTLGSHAPGFELRMFAEETPAGVHGWLEHGSHRLDEPCGKRLVDRFVSTLLAAAAAPDAPLSTLVTVTDADRAGAVESHGSVEAPSVYAAPTSDAEKQLAEIWSGAFGREMGIDDDFFGSGGHSLLAVSIFTDVQRRFGRDLPLATLFEAPTIRQLAAVVEDAEWQLDWTSLVPIKPGGAKTPIFCVAALGDEIIQFAELADLLDEDQPFYALQQGLERTDVIRTTIPEIAAHYLSEIRTVQPRGPYVLAGYCWGALVAYEMAQQLEADGETLDYLLMVEGEAPGGMYPIPRGLGERVAGGVRTIVEHGPVGSIRYAAKRIGKLWRWTIWTRLRHVLHGAFDRLGISLPDSLKDILQINAQAADDYAPTMVSYAGDIHVLRAEGMAPGFVFEDRLGWDRLVTGEISEHWLPGDHEGIWKTPNVQVFAKQLEAILEDTHAETFA